MVVMLCLLCILSLLIFFFARNIRELWLKYQSTKSKLACRAIISLNTSYIHKNTPATLTQSCHLFRSKYLTHCTLVIQVYHLPLIMQLTLMFSTVGTVKTFYKISFNREEEDKEKCQVPYRWGYVEWVLVLELQDLLDGVVSTGTKQHSPQEYPCSAPATLDNKHLRFHLCNSSWKRQSFPDNLRVTPEQLPHISSLEHNDRAYLQKGYSLYDFLVNHVWRCICVWHVGII